MSSNSQNANFRNVRARDISVKQSIQTGAEIEEPTSKAEFTAALNKLIVELQKVSGEHPDIDDAITELRSAVQETQKPKAEGNAIKRFLNTAKGALSDLVDTVTSVGTITTTITMLIGTIKTLFGG